MFGVLAIDKPAGKSSRDVVNHVQQILRPRKIKLGHTGTLDPIATGVLLVAVGPATRLTEFSHLSSKEYVGTFVLGKCSDTLDIEGKVLNTTCPRIGLHQLESVLPQFQGSIEQVPPKYSAIHIGGKRAYELARAGKEFSVPKRKVLIHAISVESFDFPRVKLRISCGTGTYIRTLGSDIAQALGSNAVMSELVRTRVGPIRLEQCVSLGELRSEDDVVTSLQSPLSLLSELPRCTLTEVGASRIRNGIAVGISEILEPATSHHQVEHLAATDEQGKLVAILKPAGRETYRSVRVFQKANETAHPISTKTKHSPES